jgi:hypothetical protein
MKNLVLNSHLVCETLSERSFAEIVKNDRVHDYSQLLLRQRSVTVAAILYPHGTSP